MLPVMLRSRFDVENDLNKSSCIADSDLNKSPHLTAIMLSSVTANVLP